ncbi:hypothetical protein Sfum_1587 [Syntrophobacter fumaroxidans MPOB]|uniref:Uncharacterized protein n=1 Tax=Syntrophobacter fumaroxidans (strain DSM 10017 / MPOB) TaxID=335543 RepID=A0LIM2_SYNFM|nr:hypothetical protein Sfum_1587 [Syntrophobacter fumaroxidans MPOB]
MGYRRASARQARSTHVVSNAHRQFNIKPTPKQGCRALHKILFCGGMYPGDGGYKAGRTVAWNGAFPARRKPGMHPLACGTLRDEMARLDRYFHMRRQIT